MQQQNLKILVLAKQVPDTRNVGKDAMTPEGTVNRAALPAIFNPEDLNALEAALRLKDRVAGSTVHILTMGPQVAEKLGLPQVTYAEEILEVREGALVIKRRLEHGTEVVECPIPAVVTVNASAAECRPRNAKRVMKYKGALAGSEIAAAPESPAAQRAAAKEYLRIMEWAAADVDPDPAQLGLQGSPTKVKRIENVVFAAKEAKKLTAADNDINELMVELIASHTLG